LIFLKIHHGYDEIRIYPWTNQASPILGSQPSLTISLYKFFTNLLITAKTAALKKDIMMNQNAKILITGHSGMVGGALTRLLKQRGYSQLLTPSHAELELRHQTQVMDYFKQHTPDYVFHLAAIVGGIHANNTYPAKFIYDNTQMHCNVIEAASEYNVKKILFPGSACTYPKLAMQPIKESAFMDGLIEPTNIAYAAAKINGIIMCQAYAREKQLNAIVPMPTNAYGMGDNFNPEASHVIPALMKRFHDAKEQGLSEVVLWGSGKPLREFIYVDDLADALIFFNGKLSIA